MEFVQENKSVEMEYKTRIIRKRVQNDDDRHVDG